MGAWVARPDGEEGGTPSPLRVNQGGYGGEGIDIERVLEEVVSVAQDAGWRVEAMGSVPGGVLWGLHRVSAKGCRVYVSAGIHGDEPAGTLAVLEMFRRGLWPGELDLWVCPCLNPGGMRLKRRENPAGKDVNRDYRHRTTEEVQAHAAWLERQPGFDLAVCLHEDWEARGFYLYELRRGIEWSAAEAVVDAVRAVCPIDDSESIDGRPARGGIIRPDVSGESRPEWPEALYLFESGKTRLSYTLEAPSDYGLAVRVRALLAGLEVLLLSKGPPAGRIDGG